MESMSDIPEETLEAIERHFHELIRSRAGDLVDEYAVALPCLAELVASGRRKGWLQIPGMYGGFSYWIEGEDTSATLVTDRWCRVVAGSERRHEITASGTRLVWQETGAAEIAILLHGAIVTDKKNEGTTSREPPDTIPPQQETPMGNTAFPQHTHFRKKKETAAAAWFAAQDDTRVSPKTRYVLARRADYDKNFLAATRSEILTQTCGAEPEHRVEPLHKWIHHGLSSQALLFNLVAPLMARDDVGALAPAFESVGVSVPNPPTARLEYDDRAVFREKQSQPTSIDLVVQQETADPDAPPPPGSIFVECKFVEQEFGGCSVFERGDCSGRNPSDAFDQCYLHSAKGRTYWSQMKEHGVLSGPLASSAFCPMVSYYQFFREVLFAAAKQGQMVFLVDADNPAFTRPEGAAQPGLIPFLTELLPPKLQQIVHVLTIQSAADAIEVSGHHNDWIGDFRSKYDVH